jgi:DNA-binding XRE family transcriptional regulator
LKFDSKKVRRARELQGYSLDTAAKEVGVAKNSFLRAEREEEIRPVTARKIAAGLQVRVADLIKEEEADPLAEAPQQLTAGVSADLRWRVFSNFEHATRALLEDVPDEERQVVANMMHRAVDRELEQVSH